jgi:hypothetical protein
MAPELTKAFWLLLQLPQFTVLGSTCLARDSVLHRRFLALVAAELAALADEPEEPS